MKNKQIIYEIHYTRVAEKFFSEHKDILVQYEDAIKRLLSGDHPEQIDIKRIKGKNSVYFRMRIGNYRVIYTIINGKIVVITTLLAGARGDIYKKAKGIK